MSAIVIQNLGKKFGKVQALRDISLQVRHSTIFGIIGSNGAGKSTTLRILCGLERLTSGKATIGGLDCWQDRAKIKRTLGYVCQNFDLYPDLTVEEQIKFFAMAFRLSATVSAQRVASLIQRTGLEAKAKSLAGTLSGGQKRLLSLACALVHEPTLLFLDEPTAGLDPSHREELWDWLYELARDGTTIVVTTHHLEEAERCLELGVMSQGQLLAHGSPAEIKATAGTKPFEVHATPLIPALEAIKKMPEVYRATLTNGAVRILAHQPEALYRQLASAWPFPEISRGLIAWVEPSLEDACTAHLLKFSKSLC